MFLCKQKTAYELRISDWSSDVGSSDLSVALNGLGARVGEEALRQGGSAVDAVMSAALAQIVLGGGAVSASLAVTQGSGQIRAGERKRGCSIGEINLAALLRAGA